MRTQLQGLNRSTYDIVFEHPVSRKLPWKDVRSMLGALAGVTQVERSGVLTVTLNGQTLELHHPIRKSMADVQELMDIRRFLGEPTADPRASAAGSEI